MTAPASWPRLPRLGALVSLHFLLVCAIKMQKGIGEDVCWLSHVALALTGAGLLTGSARFLSAALIGVLIPHSVWLFDCLGGLLFGRFPLGITAYLDGADAWTWVATAHHFYLIPVLSIVLARSRCFSSEGLPLVLALFAVLSLASRFVLAEARNVNSAFAMVPSVDLPIVHWVNDLSTLPFLVFLNAWMGLVMMWPATLLLKRWSPQDRDAAPLRTRKPQGLVALDR